MSYSAVIFDLGGVVLGSPVIAIREYAVELGVEATRIGRLIMETTPHGAWSRLERGELSLEEFYPAFEADCREDGLEVDARALMARVAVSSAPRPRMLRAIETLREAGLRVAALTNNWANEDRERSNHSEELKPYFHLVVESAVEGLRKPDPRIYTLACERLGVTPAESVFLDDIGQNLKPARALGMHTIKVDDPDDALAELEAVLSLELR